MSGFVPASKVTVMDTRPVESDVDDMYIRPSRPVMFCSMICVTVFSIVSAEAPG